MKFETGEVRTAWLKVVKTLVNPKNTAENPFLKNKYAPLHEVLDYLKKEFIKEGFIIVQEACYDMGVCKVRTEFIAEFGTAISEWAGTENKKDPQGTGSSITYLRRYQLLSICGLVGEKDDDGEGAMDRPDPILEKIDKATTIQELTTLYKTFNSEQKEKYLDKLTGKKNKIEGGK